MKKLLSVKCVKLTAVILTLSMILLGMIGKEASAEASLEMPSDKVSKSSNHVTGNWPAGLNTVSLEFVDQPLTKVIGAVAKQAHLDLILADPAGTAQEKVTVQLSDRPVRETLELLMKLGDLNADIRGNLLTVTSVQKKPQAEATEKNAALTENDVENIKTPERRLEHRKHWKHWKHRHDKKRISFGKSLMIKKGEEVDKAVVIGGTLTVAGRVRKNAVAIGGDVILTPSAEIGGNAVSIGGEVYTQPGAVLEGNKVNISENLGGIVGAIAEEMSDKEMFPGGIFAIYTIAKLLKVALLLVLTLLIATFAPGRYVRIRDYMIKNPGRSALAGMIIMLAMLPITLILLVTVIGIPLIPLAWVILFTLMLFGLTAILTWMGDKVPPRRNKKTPLGALAMGSMLLLLASAVPILGAVLMISLSFFGAGAALLSKLGNPTSDMK